MPRLLVASRKIALDFAFERAISIGRHVANSLPLADPEVSRHHAQIFPREEGFCISDLGSRNGVYVNGEKTSECPIKPGDEIGLGNTLLFFDPPDEADIGKNLSKYGRPIWDGLPTKMGYIPAETTVFSPVEMEERVFLWLAKKNAATLLPQKTRSRFLDFTLRMDSARHRGELCDYTLQHLQKEIGFQRAMILAPQKRRKTLQILARQYAQDTAEDDREFRIHKDILRVALDSHKAAYCSQCTKDFRFKHLVDSKQKYILQSFIVAPLFVMGEFYAFLYMDEPAGGQRYKYENLAQTYITAAILAKALHWYQVGREKVTEPDLGEMPT